MIPALVAVCFVSALDGQQVVTHRDHRKEDRNEHDQRDELTAAVSALVVSAAKPQTCDDPGNQQPREIEK